MTSLHCVHLAQDIDSEGGWAAWEWRNSELLVQLC